MKSYWIVTKDHKAGLEQREVPVPQPKAGEVLVKVHASAMNRGEIFVGGVMHGGAEKLGGNEGAGVIHALGEGVTGFKVGDRVMGRGRGMFSEFGLLETHQIIPVPSRLTWEQAAATVVFSESRSFTSLPSRVLTESTSPSRPVIVPRTRTLTCA